MKVNRYFFSILILAGASLFFILKKSEDGIQKPKLVLNNEYVDDEVSAYSSNHPVEAVPTPVVEFIKPQEGIMNNQKQGERFKIGDTAFPILYEDQDCSKELKKLIADDINLIFSHLNKYEIMPIGSKQIVRALGEDREITHFIHFIGPQYGPGNYKDYFGRLVEIKGEYHLIVPEPLIQAYERALVFKKQHSEAFDQLNHFLNTMNRISEINLRGADLKSMFYISDSSLRKEFDAMSHQELEKKMRGEYGKYKWRPPSILEVKYGDEFGRELPHEIISNNYIYNDDGYFDSGIPFIYHNRKWKIFIPEYGT